MEGAGGFRFDSDQFAPATKPSHRTSDQATTTNRNENGIGVQTLCLPFAHHGSLSANCADIIIRVN